MILGLQYRNKTLEKENGNENPSEVWKFHWPKLEAKSDFEFWDEFLSEIHRNPTSRNESSIQITILLLILVLNPWKSNQTQNKNKPEKKMKFDQSKTLDSLKLDKDFIMKKEQIETNNLHKLREFQLLKE